MTINVMETVRKMMGWCPLVGMKNMAADSGMEYTINKVVNPPMGLIVIGLLLLAAMLGLLIISSVMSGDWKLTLSIACLLPLYLLLKHKQDKEYHNLDTQLYIQCEDKNRSKGWYELTNASYYSIITDEKTASEIQASIEHYRGAN